MATAQTSALNFDFLERKLLPLFCLASFLLHMMLVFWFSSRTPDLQNLENDQFEVGLISSEGLGDALQASLPASQTAETISPDIILPSTEKAVEQAVDVAPEVSSDQLNLSEIAPAETPQLSPDTITSPVVTDIQEAPIASPAQRESSPATAQDVQPLEVADQIMPEASAPEANTITDAISPVQAIPNSAPVDDFFQPAEILAPGDPITRLPIENVSQVAEPDIVLADINPELVNDDVEILEIKARDVLPVRPARTTAQVTPSSTTTERAEGQGNNARTPNQAGRQTGQLTTQQSLPNQSTTVSPPPPVPKTYILELRKWLNQFKQYPLQAYQQRQEGVVIVGLVINQQGEILSHSIKRSSGHVVLDDEVDQMLQRAKKMPAFPADYPREQLELLIPIRFRVSQ